MRNYNTFVYMKTKTSVLDKIAIVLFIVLLTVAFLSLG